ncbi:hypothetical protein Aasi_0002 [Candidatus Amoebophilus asiaticus 5a2]|uniref:Uncharacterized protein n=1 Tax=Amoebophilus asiaticus (strain 5a2) TaxID=452471 RepID=B3EU41_AMOA5|nr:hypothetical protein Aasi_0002 [Candidatus Amoebophilus asiaticus 5a2]
MQYKMKYHYLFFIILILEKLSFSYGKVAAGIQPRNELIRNKEKKRS